jgi:hypothetical protein
MPITDRLQARLNVENGHVERNKESFWFASSILLAASLAAAPAIAKKPAPPPPPPTDPDPWAGCTPWGPVVYGVDCCDYPELVIPCTEGQTALEPARLSAIKPANTTKG